jgi:hypothetical protein
MTGQPEPGQAPLAEAEMTRWLSYGTELGDRPDEIELVRTTELVDADGPSDLFVFRFRTKPPQWAADRGWMIGVAGPFLRSRQPTPQGLGFTFSRLEREDAMTIEGHVDQLIGTIAEWAAHDRGDEPGRPAE